MRVLQIGGSRQGAGKTSLGCALIGVLPQYEWMALKITTHGHGGGDRGGLSEESRAAKDRADNGKDTSRYLAAGARRAWLVEGEVPESFWRARELDDGLLVVESNGRLGWGVAPCAFLAVADDGPDTWKASFAARWREADALVLSGVAAGAAWAEEGFAGEIFRLAAGRWVADSLVEAVLRLLEGEIRGEVRGPAGR